MMQQAITEQKNYYFRNREKRLLYQNDRYKKQKAYNLQTKFECKQCGHKWHPRPKNKTPEKCTKCKTKYWNISEKPKIHSSVWLAKYWNGRKQSPEHLKKRIDNSKKTFRKNHPPIKTNCNFCHTKIFYQPYKYNLSNRHFCNKKCKGEFMKQNYNIYFTEQRNNNLSKAHKGKKFSEKHKKNISEVRIKKGLYKLEKNPRWLGGISFESYTPDFHRTFKQKIRERDNKCCIVCNKPEEELKEKLSIHHIDYNKKNSFFQNCVSLCRSCHTITNNNREKWKTFFQSLLKDRYSYEYTQDQKIILDFTKND